MTDSIVSPKYLGCEGFARRTGFAQGTIRNMTSRGEGPRSFKVAGGRRLWKTADIDAWIESGGTVRSADVAAEGAAA